MKFILSRLKEPSTWRGIIIVLGIFGVNFSPDKTEAIVSAGVALIALIEVFRRETVPGGKFNPNAESRPASPANPEPIRTQGRGRAGLIALLLVPALMLGGCADKTPHTTVVRSKNGVFTSRQMTHKEAKLASYTFIERNSDQAWAWPILLMRGLYEFSK